MRSRITILFLLSCLLACGCGADLMRIQSELKVGMSKSEVAQILGGRGTLKKEEAGHEWGCAAGHSWCPAEHPRAPQTCPVCSKPGRPRPEQWILYRTNSRVWGAVYLSMTFDGNGNLDHWAVGDL